MNLHKARHSPLNHKNTSNTPEVTKPLEVDAANHTSVLLLKGLQIPASSEKLDLLYYKPYYIKRLYNTLVPKVCN